MFLGFEKAGTIAQIGAIPGGFAVGDRVAYFGFGYSLVYPGLAPAQPSRALCFGRRRTSQMSSKRGA